MILSVSRRTDIPALYTPWFLNRIREGFVLVRNPMNYHQVSRVSLSPAVIDCIVFWTKNAAPLVPFLGEIADRYPYYFQFTLNGYGRAIEPGLPPLGERMDTFRKLSQICGAERMVWRYDPILLTEETTVDWHVWTFGKMARELKGTAQECVFSFIDLYDKVSTNIKGLGIRGVLPEEAGRIAEAFSALAKENGFRLRTCAEAVDFNRLGIEHGCCIDGERIARIIGARLSARKDPNQREECRCLESVDIGQYNTCRHGCRYCYANFNARSVATLSAQHSSSSPFLIGTDQPGDKITDRKMKSLRTEPIGQLSMF